MGPVNDISSSRRFNFIQNKYYFVSFLVLTVLLVSVVYFYTDSNTVEKNIPQKISSQSSPQSQVALVKETSGVEQTLALTPTITKINPVITSRLLLPMINKAYGSASSGTSTTWTDWVVPTSTTLGEIKYMDCSIFITFTEISGNKIVTQNGNQFNEWSLPQSNSSPTSIVTDPSNSNIVYFTENSGDRIGSLNTNTNTFTEWNLPGGVGLTSIGIDSTGNVYFTESTVNKIGQINPLTNAFKTWDVPTSSSGLGHLTVDSANNVYFTETTANKIGKLNPISNGFSEWTLPTASSGVNAIRPGLAAGTVYFTEPLANKIGSLVTPSNTFTEWTIPTAGSKPTGIALDAYDGLVFFTENATSKIGRLTPSNNVFTEWLLTPAPFNPGNLDVRGASGCSFGGPIFTEEFNNAIGNLS